MEEVDELAFLFAVEVAPTTTYLLQLGSSGFSFTFLVSLEGLKAASSAGSRVGIDASKASPARVMIRSSWRRSSAMTSDSASLAPSQAHSRDLR